LLRASARDSDQTFSLEARNLALPMRNKYWSEIELPYDIENNGTSQI
jgi:hypothetical protein